MRHAIGMANRSVLLAAAFLAACSSVNGRIKKHQAEFDAYPAETQRLIRAGEVRPGFTAAQVELALGEPDGKYTRTSDAGKQEVWTYGGERPRPEMEVGVGMPLGNVATSVGIGLESTPRYGERLRIVLEGGRVTSVEKPKI